MKKFLCVILSLCFFYALIVSSAASDPRSGEVLFAQRYADFDDPRETGIRVGTGGGVPAVSADGGLRIDVIDDRKAYLLLPDMPDGAAWTDTYTVEFSFRFTDVSAANGYFGFLLTATGDAPLNRTELLLRANGACDGVGQLGEEITAAIADGMAVSVSVPVLHGMMYEVTVKCGAYSETMTLPSVRTIGEGRRGFVLRNASAEVQGVSVTNGVDYDRKFGKYASESYRPAEEDLADLPSPSTGDGMLCAILLALGAAGGAIYIHRRRARA